MLKFSFINYILKINFVYANMIDSAIIHILKTLELLIFSTKESTKQTVALIQCTRLHNYPIELGPAGPWLAFLRRGASARSRSGLQEDAPGTRLQRPADSFSLVFQDLTSTYALSGYLAEPGETDTIFNTSKVWPYLKTLAQGASEWLIYCMYRICRITGIFHF